jgi:hypothetical protein
MSADLAGTRSPWRSARECALGVCAAWLLVQNVVLLIALLVAGPAAAWSLLAPLLGVAFVLMTPLWLVPVILLLAGRTPGTRVACPPTHEVMR